MDGQIIADHAVQEGHEARGDLLDHPNAVSDQNFFVVELHNGSVDTTAMLHAKADGNVPSATSFPEFKVAILVQRWEKPLVPEHTR